MNAVNRFLTLAAALVLCTMPVDVQAQSGDDSLRAQFEAIVDGLNDNSFRLFQEALDQNAYTARVFGTGLITDEVKTAFTANFWPEIESGFVAAFPRPQTQGQAGSEITGAIIAFTEESGEARAIVRYVSAGYRYSYHAYDLQRGRGGRVQIIDWFDYYQSEWFSKLLGDGLLRVTPGQSSVASVLEIPRPTNAQLFQVGELMKSVRDRNAKRYFQIYEGLDDTVLEDPYVVEMNYHFCRMLRDPVRLGAAVSSLLASFPGDPRFSLGLSEHYVQWRRFEEAIVELERLADGLGQTDGVIESLKATAAMALGEFERAQAFALEATRVEEGLELAWWTLLRTRTAAEDYAGATEAMTQLEDRFGHLLIPQKLQRDRFLKVLIKQQEYKDWRAARDQA